MKIGEAFDTFKTPAIALLIVSSTIGGVKYVFSLNDRANKAEAEVEVVKAQTELKIKKEYEPILKEYDKTVTNYAIDLAKCR